ncbi:hypothetical protein JYK14_13220 [Siccirubricoccus sp. KC 17139]|uniref:Uncharacterized protein n=1 Tax=Siccirubricoccus soli TaxID=2899147 RepID=A0ABT1D789_9PROT|nr:hypothetical protein [Siccirubricoccus soli]MCO6417115.1 hypothetical protein [Siccirubricoccus soli]MCP2683250.1 hypothetical protein [Siccirubricoccus soli]
MPPKITEAEFEALVARAGLTLTPAQTSAIYAVYGGVEAWQAAIRTPTPAPEAEPATTFSAEPGR